MKQRKIKSRLFSASLIAPAAGISFCLLFLVLCAKNPGQALVSLLSGTFTTQYAVGNFLNTAALLMTAGIGAAISVKSGNMNLGGEGQIYFGGYVAALVLTAPWHAPAAVVFIAS